MAETIVKDIDELIEWVEDTIDEIVISKLEDGSYRIIDEREE